MIRRLTIRAAFLAMAAALIPACGGDGDDGTTTIIQLPPLGSGGGTLDDGTSPWILPGGSPGLTLVSRGGNGTTGKGGNGGGFQVHSLGASNARVLSTGSVVGTFVVPVGNPELGTNPLTVSSNTVVTPTTPGGISSFLGDDGINPATGLHVLAGVTLVFAPNIDADNDDLDGNPATGNFDYVHVSVSQGVLIEGLVRTAHRNTSLLDRSDLRFSSATFVVTPTGSFDTSGDDAAPGDDGGLGGEVFLEAAGTFVLQGSFNTSGGDGDNGGRGGPVSFHTGLWGIYNTGPITTSGGTGADGMGGHAGRIHFFPSFSGGSFTGGGIFNSGDLTARGGNGTTGGGNGEWVRLSSYPFTLDMDGPVVSTGDIDNSGGNATVSGNGGHGGDDFFGFGLFGIYITSIGGHVRVTGTLTCRGGNGAGAGNGGHGRIIEISSNSGSGNNGQVIECGNYIGASMDASGGNGAVGGNGGILVFWDNANFLGNAAIPGKSPIWFVGVASIDVSGGAGGASGGNGAPFEIYNWPTSDPGGTLWYGSILNEANVTSRGGNGAAGNGGNGGFSNLLALGSQAQQSSGDPARAVINRGSFDLRGGTGTQFGGTGGSYNQRDVFQVQNYGDIDTSGGNSGISPAGGGNFIYIGSDGTTVNEAALTANGGSSSADRGGSGGQIFVEGKQARHTGPMDSRGGNGTTNSGGNGGSLEIGSFDAIPTPVSGKLSVPFGTGLPDGRVGIITIDGIRVALKNGSVSF